MALRRPTSLRAGLRATVAAFVLVSALTACKGGQDASGPDKAKKGDSAPDAVPVEVRRMRWLRSGMSGSSA